MSQVPMIKLKNKKLTGIWFNWNLAFFDLIITNRSNSRLIIEPRSQEIIGCAGFLNFTDNENIEFGFASILSKNITHWDFDNEHSAKNKTEWICEI